MALYQEDGGNAPEARLVVLLARHAQGHALRPAVAGRVLVDGGIHRLEGSSAELALDAKRADTHRIAAGDHEIGAFPVMRLSVMGSGMGREGER